MPSFLVRGLAHYIAASAMESRERRKYSYTPTSGDSFDDKDKLCEADCYIWQNQMRWLIPFVQATDYQVVIENPKSHEQIIINKNTKGLPVLTLEWMEKYNKQELLDWMANEQIRQEQERKEKLKRQQTLLIEEARGRERFGNSFTLVDKNNQEEKKSQNNNKNNYVIPILCVVVFILALIGYLVYNSSFFDGERWRKEHNIEVNMISALTIEESNQREFRSSVATF